MMTTRPPLTYDQQTAVDYPFGTDLCIVAGPGSGKTETLTSRICRALREGFAVVAVSYTNNAAAQLRTRIARELGQEPDQATCFVGTLHSLAVHTAKGGGLHYMAPGFTFLPDVAIEALIDDAIEAHKAKLTREERGKITQRDPFEVFQMIPQNKAAIVARTVWNEFQRQNGWPYDVALWELLHLVERWKGRLLFVDEVQDAGTIDGLIYRCWPGRRTFVGDPRQAIYGFRGGSTDFIRSLMEEAPVVHLDETFRFGGDICATANDIAKGFTGWKLPPISPALPDQPAGDVSMKEAASVAEEVSTVFEIIRETDQSKSVGILCRTNAQVAEWTEAFKGVFPDVSGALESPEEAGEARYLTALGAFVLSQTSEAALFALSVAVDGPEEARRSLRASRAAGASEGILGRRWNLPRPESVATVGALADWLASKVAYIPRDRVLTIAGDIGREMPAEALLPGLYWQLTKAGRESRIEIMTQHAAKGLEFDVVILPGTEWRKKWNENEERRLFYVAATRARESLFVTWSRYRKAWEGGQPEPTIKNPFVIEIERAIESEAQHGH